MIRWIEQFYPLLNMIAFLLLLYHLNQSATNLILGQSSFYCRVMATPMYYWECNQFIQLGNFTFMSQPKRQNIATGYFFQDQQILFNVEVENRMLFIHSNLAQYIQEGC